MDFARAVREYNRHNPDLRAAGDFETASWEADSAYSDLVGIRRT